MAETNRTAFFRTGWIRFPFDPRLTCWLDAIRPAALRSVRDPDQRRRWLRHNGTWFVGVGALQNGTDGAVDESGPLTGRAVDFISRNMGVTSWDPGQVSICYRGYPGRDPQESEASHRYRQNRDAAHFDGLHPVGPERRRHLQELHRFILGIPLTDSPAEAAPFVVWEGSHELMRDLFRRTLGSIEPKRWHEIDMTDVYHRARRKIWSVCTRREIPARPGEAYLVHRMALHGMAPWPAGLAGSEDGRAIVYFRPAAPLARGWLDMP